MKSTQHLLNLLATTATVMVSAQGNAPLKVADLNPNGASMPSSLTIGGAANDKLVFECKNNYDERCIYTLTNSSVAPARYSASKNDQQLLAVGGDHCFFGNTSTLLGLAPDAFSAVYYKHLGNSVDANGTGGSFQAPNKDNSVVFNGRLITAGAIALPNQNFGIEPYSVDPSTGTATLLKNIQAGPAPSDPSGFIQFGGKVFFTANNSTSGRELYITDGTAAGTSLLKDLLIGAVGSDPQGFRDLAGRLYFTALSAVGNREPWTSDGTTAGTVKLKEINPSATIGSDPKEFTALGNKVLFTADNGSNGREVWITDGTANGTVMAKDIITGIGGSAPHDLTVFGKKVWFIANGTTLRIKGLYATDGTAAGTVQMLALPTSTDAENLQVCNGKLFYVTRDATTSKLWCTEGTKASTKQPQPAVSPSINPIGTERMAVLGNWLYFSGNFDQQGAELWKVQ